MNMKNKLYFLVGIFCCLFACLTIRKANSLQMFNSLSLTDINTLAYAEEDGDGNENSGNSSCETVITSSYTFQDCQGTSKYWRTTLNFKCKGNDVGACIEGVEYIYYDCDGYVIKKDARTEGKSCK